MNKIVESCSYVAEHSSFIQIDLQKIDAFCDSFAQIPAKHWIDASPIDLKALSPRNCVHFLLVFNSISFSYWGNPKWKIDYQGNEVDGAFGMLSALKKAHENGFPILDPHYLAQISEKDFEKILEGNVDIPLFEERRQILHEIGKTLIEKFDGNFFNVLSQANQNALELLDLIVKNFPSFHDSSEYKGKTIYFYKRAQLLVADIFQALQNEEPGKLKNISELTACADYKLPMVLRRLGIFSYEKTLAEKIDKKIELQKDSEEEVEIRANTIYAVEKIKEKLQEKIPGKYLSLLINDHLWLLGQEKHKDDKPYHLTRTTAY